jgi:hypothetical protein
LDAVASIAGTLTTSAQKEPVPGWIAPSSDAPSSSTVTAMQRESLLVRLIHASETRNDTTCTNSVNALTFQYCDCTSSAVMIAPFSAKSTSNWSQPGQRLRSNSAAIAFWRTIVNLWKGNLAIASRSN